KNSTIKIDTTAPVTTAVGTKINGSSYTFGTWAYDNVTVNLTCSDGSGSGCNRTRYCISTVNNCTPNVTYSGPVLMSSEGIYYIRYQSIDNVNNTEGTENRTVMVMVYRAPILNFTAYPALFTRDRNNYFEISYLALNRSVTKLTVDNKNYTMSCNDTNCWATVRSRRGFHTYHAWMSDTAGRNTTTATFNFTVDYTRPRTSYTSASVRNHASVVDSAFFQVRYYETNLGNATFYVTDTGTLTTTAYLANCSTGARGHCNATVSSLTDGHSYSYYAVVYDLAGNMRRLSSRTFSFSESP
ncbi:MAG: hypothetical protein PHS02_03190, partial [Candidatus ainarchaeum sp.]|nr:hypothetical protein [Candidatus ainarchaeum sp.]